MTGSARLVILSFSNAQWQGDRLNCNPVASCRAWVAGRASAAGALFNPTCSFTASDTNLQCFVSDSSPSGAPSSAAHFQTRSCTALLAPLHYRESQTDRTMPPKAAGQQQRQEQPGGGSADGKPAGGNGGQKVMNYFAALAGTADAESQLEEIAAEEDRRRQASTSSGGGGGGSRAANGKKAGGGLQQPLVWIDLGAYLWVACLEVASVQICQLILVCRWLPAPQGA